MIEQGRRNLNERSKDNLKESRVEIYLKKLKNHPILSIIIIVGIIVIAIGSFTDALKTIFETIKPYIRNLFN